MPDRDAAPISSASADGTALRRVVADGPLGPVLLVDSVTQIAASDGGAWVVTGSHGGVSAARYALVHPVSLVVFNDAGIGKDGAGIAALDRLQARGRAAATVSHDSARIGDAEDAWRHGRVSCANAAAQALGVRPGLPLRPAVLAAAGAVEADGDGACRGR